MISAERATLYRSDKLVNRFLWEVLPDGAWKNKPCFIVGGGPSLKDFNWHLLKGKRTIGINRAFEKFEPTVMFSMDTRFLKWLLNDKYGSSARDRFLSLRSYRVWLCTYTVKLPDYIYIVKVYRHYRAGLKAFTESLKEGIGHGNNSGYAALNLAACLGGNPIYLLGFDCKFSNGKTHWHDGHPAPQSEKVINGFVRFFEKSASIIKARGIRVINLCPDSALNCFEKKAISEVLH